MSAGLLHLSLIVLLILPLMAVIAGISDLTTMRIPNRISLILLISYFPIALTSGLDWAVIGLSSAIAFALLIIGMAMFALRWVGGGDAKLLASLGLWMGVTGLLPFLLYTALIGGLLSIVLLNARSWMQVYSPSLPGWGQRLMKPMGDIPYGVAIAGGALCAYPESIIFQILILP